MGGKSFRREDEEMTKNKRAAIWANKYVRKFGNNFWVQAITDGTLPYQMLRFAWLAGFKAGRKAR